MDRELSSELTSRMPIVPHENAGVECCGCIIAAVDGTNVELRCNECGAVVGVVHLDVLKGLLGLECATTSCPQDSPRQVTHSPGDNILPSWSRDGNAIYFTSKRSGEFEVWRVAAHGGKEEQITRNGGYLAFESTDTKTLYYTLSQNGAEGLYAKSLPDGVEVQAINENVVARGLAVFSDGAYYLHCGQNDCDIRFYEFAGARVQVMRKIGVPLDAVSGLAVSPDRQTFLYSILVRHESDLMLIENFR